jgi:hypothetical protein
MVVLQWLFALSETFLQNWGILIAIVKLHILQFPNFYFAINNNGGPKKQTTQFVGSGKEHLS